MPVPTTTPRPVMILKAIESLLMSIGPDTNCYSRGVCWSRAGSFEDFLNADYNKMARFEQTLLAVRMSTLDKDRISGGPTIYQRFTHGYVLDCIAVLSKEEIEAGFTTDILVERAFDDFGGLLGTNDNIPIKTKLEALYPGQQNNFIIHRQMGHQVLPDGYRAHPFVVFQVMSEFDYDQPRR